MAPIIYLLVGLAIATYASILTGIGYLIRSNRQHRETVMAFMLRQQFINEQQAEWKDAINNALRQNTNDIEDLEETLTRHAAEIRKNQRGIEQIKHRMDDHDKFREWLLKHAKRDVEFDPPFLDSPSSH